MRNPTHPPSRERPLVLVLTITSALLLVACGRIAGGEPGAMVPDGDPIVGQALLSEYQCMTCHVIPGTQGPETYVGPPLTEWSKREYIAGNLPNTPTNLIDWIVNPQQIEPGTVMPTLGVSPAATVEPTSGSWA